MSRIYNVCTEHGKEKAVCRALREIEGIEILSIFPVKIKAEASKLAEIAELGANTASSVGFTLVH